MTKETDDKQKKKTLSLSSKKLELKKTIDAGQIRQSFSHGRSKAVEFEVKRKRILESGKQKSGSGAGLGGLSKEQLEERVRLLREAEKQAAEATSEQEAYLKRIRDIDAERSSEHTQKLEEEKRREEEERLKREEAEEKRRIADEQARLAALEEEKRPRAKVAHKSHDPAAAESIPAHPHDDKKGGGFFEGAKVKSKKEEDEEAAAKKASRKTLSLSTREARQKLHGLSFEQALSDEAEEERQRSLAAVRRARDKRKEKAPSPQDAGPVVREVVITEVITVQELANRMAIRAVEVIKKLMGLGIMATANQAIDADTAELIVSEFGHTFRRVSDSDVEEGLIPDEDPKELLKPRAPVVTVMGHVDHGKTSLLDAIRSADVVASEAGGITQHIGAYQVAIKGDQKITFIDTPGHAAFSEMRARGADVTDIVVLVVAADDGIKDQTVEAINHAKAAGVPIIVAINKIDKPDANPDRVRNELLSYEIVVEDMGGDVQAVEVSAKTQQGIDKLEEAILLQAEILELGANPNRDAIGAVIEARVERGRGPVATILIQRGTLKVGDVFVAGSQWGKVRALINDRGTNITEATPSVPVEVLGFSGAPEPGDTFVVVADEARARDIADYRERKEKQRKAALARKTSLDLLMEGKSEHDAKILSVIVKADVQGSAEAIIGSLAKIESDEVIVKIVHSGVGAINESDVTLAQTTNAFVVGFNVRANPQAADLALREGIELRYYSIIYDVIDDLKQVMSGLLAPELREKFLGYAEIRDVFNITKVGKVAGCYVTSGDVRRGAKVRLLRDNVVIHEGSLKTLKRFKDEVKEVKEGYECGMAFENYNDLKVGDVIECFEVQEIARAIE